MNKDQAADIATELLAHVMNAGKLSSEEYIDLKYSLMEKLLQAYADGIAWSAQSVKETFSRAAAEAAKAA